MPRADWQFVGNVRLSFPPLPEQSAIVRFLDHADRRIRRYIRAKQKLIKLLEEQKQAIIHRAVTRGLDPNVRLKPSGVEWLGDVPEHWEVVRVKELSTPIDKVGLPNAMLSQRQNEVLSRVASSETLLTSIKTRSARHTGAIFLAFRSGGDDPCGELIVTSWIGSLGQSTKS